MSLWIFYEVINKGEVGFWEGCRPPGDRQTMVMGHSESVVPLLSSVISVIPHL
jgi:hypothetical protein